MQHAVVASSGPQPVSEAAATLRALAADGAPYLNGARPFSDSGKSMYRSRSTTTMLINGCGRSGTHALVALMRRHGVR